MKKINKLTQNHYIFGLDDIAAGMAISAIVGAIATAASSAVNAGSTAITNKKNENLTREAWQRDDMQLQRARQDAEKAGFSPLAALSNNLTNTAPATMQAPQVDASAIGNSISNVGRAYTEGKYSKEQIEALKIENKFNKQDLLNRQIKSATETAKLIKEVQGINLDNTQKAQLLINAGVPSSTVKKYFSDAEGMKKDPQAQATYDLTVAQTNLANAQKALVNEQSTTQTNQRALLDAQAALSGIQKTIYENENNYNWNQKISVYTPVITSEGNGVKIDWEYTDSIPRKQAFDLIKNAIDTLAIKKAGQDVNSDTFNKIFKALDSVIPF